MILAGITLLLVLGQNGIISKTMEAKETSANAEKATNNTPIKDDEGNIITIPARFRDHECANTRNDDFTFRVTLYM